MLYLTADKTKRFYVYASLFFATGWLWALLSLTGEGFSVCVFKNITGVPCPACGSTSGLVHLVHGECAAAFAANPLSYLIAVGLLVFPLWVFWDVWMREVSLYSAVQRFDAWVRRRPVVLVFILLGVVLNWVLKVS